ncbi:MAG: response regulator [Rhodobacteraceae bacterium]|nr:response regulator [Paracoccaceae bacterium]
MMNLVVNARDAMPEGGEIRVAATVEILSQKLERDRASVPPGEYVVLRVSDEGGGIAPDQLPKIFEPFFTTKPTGKGTGLGLSTVYGIVKQSGGFIFADSQTGSGSCFTLYFPAHEHVAEAPVQPLADGQFGVLPDPALVDPEPQRALPTPSIGETVAPEAAHSDRPAAPPEVPAEARPGASPDDAEETLRRVADAARESAEDAADAAQPETYPARQASDGLIQAGNGEDAIPRRNASADNLFRQIETAAGSSAPDKDGPEVTDGADAVVLLVEDEAPVRAFASRALRMRGYQVIEAENAEEALEMLEDSALEVDVFVTDVIMPGMDRPGWVSQALKQRPDTRVVFVSGYSEDSVADSRARIPNSVFLPIVLKNSVLGPER